MLNKKENFIDIALRRVIILKKFLTSGMKLAIPKSYWKNKIIISALILSLLANISLWIFLFKNQKSSELPIILHYNLFFGVDYLGNYNEIYTMPIIGLIIIIINTFLGCLLYKKERLVSYFLVFNILIIQLILLFASYLIVKINS